jgi:hypothetical protein
MSAKPVWKELLSEPNALGWIGLIVLVTAIGFGALFFHGGAPAPDRAWTVTHAAR